MIDIHTEFDPVSLVMRTVVECKYGWRFEKKIFNPNRVLEDELIKERVWIDAIVEAHEEGHRAEREKDE